MRLKISSSKTQDFKHVHIKNKENKKESIWNNLEEICYAMAALFTLKLTLHLDVTERNMKIMKKGGYKKKILFLFFRKKCLFAQFSGH